MYVNYLIGAERRLGWFDGNQLRRLSGPPTDQLVLEGFPDVPDDAPVEGGGVRCLPALIRPGKILCLLRSYLAHADEFGHEPPPEPMFFAKLPSALLGHMEPILIPPWLEGEVHHEGELALVIGRKGKRIPPDAAKEHIAAYTVANDVTARTLQKADAGRGWPWVRGKGLDTFLPLGPGLVPAERVGDPAELGLEVRVNGDLRQQGSVSRLLWTVPEIVSHLSKYVTLEPGDLILTGTPEGVGPLVPGDRVEVEIDGLGHLENPVEAEE